MTGRTERGQRKHIIIVCSGQEGCASPKGQYEQRTGCRNALQARQRPENTAGRLAVACTAGSSTCWADRPARGAVRGSGAMHLLGARQGPRRESDRLENGVGPVDLQAKPNGRQAHPWPGQGGSRCRSVPGPAAQPSAAESAAATPATSSTITPCTAAQGAWVPQLRAATAPASLQPAGPCRMCRAGCCSIPLHTQTQCRSRASKRGSQASAGRAAPGRT